MIRHALTSLAAFACLAAGLLAAPAAQATTDPGAAALTWAEGHATGRPYVYGGTGPYGYDCSGTIYAAFGDSDHIRLPRSTYGMLTSPHLHRIPLTDTRPGDLLFFGAISHGVRGPAGRVVRCPACGTVVGFHHYSGSWRPTLAFRVS